MLVTRHARRGEKRAAVAKGIRGWEGGRGEMDYKQAQPLGEDRQTATTRGHVWRKRGGNCKCLPVQKRPPVLTFIIVIHLCHSSFRPQEETVFRLEKVTFYVLLTALHQLLAQWFSKKLFLA